MNFIFWYFVIGIFVAAIKEVFVAAEWGRMYRTTLASILLSTILWPVAAYQLVRDFLK